MFNRAAIFSYLLVHWIAGNASPVYVHYRFVKNLGGSGCKMLSCKVTMHLLLTYVWTTSNLFPFLLNLSNNYEFERKNEIYLVKGIKLCTGEKILCIIFTNKNLFWSWWSKFNCLRVYCYSSEFSCSVFCVCFYWFVMELNWKFVFAFFVKIEFSKKMHFYKYMYESSQFVIVFPSVPILYYANHHHIFVRISEVLVILVKPYHGFIATM